MAKEMFILHIPSKKELPRLVVTGESEMNDTVRVQSKANYLFLST